MKNRIYIKDLKENVGKEVTIAGWVDVRRDQGKMVFFDMRDMTGLVQCVTLPVHTEAIARAKEIRGEWVVSVKGLVKKRGDKGATENNSVELEVLDIEVLNKAETAPFPINEDTAGINEDTRMKYKYLDLRTARMQKNIRMRGKIIKYIRDYLEKENFTEVETPILTKSTPEGARDYIVPSRLWQGKFYALPQSPQQYKQLLMAGGIE